MGLGGKSTAQRECRTCYGRGGVWTPCNGESLGLGQMFLDKDLNET